MSNDTLFRIESACPFLCVRRRIYVGVSAFASSARRCESVFSDEVRVCVCVFGNFWACAQKIEVHHQPPAGSQSHHHQLPFQRTRTKTDGSLCHYFCSRINNSKRPFSCFFWSNISFLLQNDPYVPGST
jgi:hypothetical protein